MSKVQKYAGVMELVDMQDLGSCVLRRGGSSPFARTSSVTLHPVRAFDFVLKARFCARDEKTS